MRVALCEDSTLLREGLARILSEAGFEVVASVESPEALLTDVARFRPNVAIVDIRLPPTYTDEGLRAAATLRRLHPDVGVLVLSQFA